MYTRGGARESGERPGISGTGGNWRRSRHGKPLGARSRPNLLGDESEERVLGEARLLDGRPREDGVHEARDAVAEDAVERVDAGVPAADDLSPPTIHAAVAATCRHGLSTSRPRRRRDSSPRTIHVPAAAVPRSTDYPRPGRGGAAIHGLFTSRPRRPRDSSPRAIRVPAAASPRLLSADYPRGDVLLEARHGPRDLRRHR